MSLIAALQSERAGYAVRLVGALEDEDQEAIDRWASRLAQVDEQLAVLEPEQLAVLEPEQLAVLEPEQVAVLEPEQVGPVEVAAETVAAPERTPHKGEIA